MSVLVYISHPYGGKEENKQKIEEIVKTLAVLHKDTVFCRLFTLLDSFTIVWTTTTA